MKRLLFSALALTLALTPNIYGMEQILMGIAAISITQQEQTTTECSICLKNFTTANKPVVCACESNMHVFHEPCIKSWVSHNQSCPNCRQKIDAMHIYRDSHELGFLLLKYVRNFADMKSALQILEYPDLDIDVNIEDESGLCPLELAIYKLEQNSNYALLIEALLKHPLINPMHVSSKLSGAISAFNIATYSEKASSVIPLFLAHPKIATNTREGASLFTPLMQAAFFGRKDTVKILLSDTRVNPTLQNLYGETALNCAQRGKNYLLRGCSLYWPADPEKIQNFDNTIYMLAVAEKKWNATHSATSTAPTTTTIQATTTTSNPSTK
ncbi:MAG: hypothetical protein UU47_C0002G0050 [candidate division TM6 bacterium GW2011_GWE2_41_16]|nr:MAG: hypothetical protein UU47_C0002G0050 [candidate division TM6 bacterium GW2011_GWE2_41_16]